MDDATARLAIEVARRAAHAHVARNPNMGLDKGDIAGFILLAMVQQNVPAEFLGRRAKLSVKDWVRSHIGVSNEKRRKAASWLHLGYEVSKDTDGSPMTVADLLYASGNTEEDVEGREQREFLLSLLDPREQVVAQKREEGCEVGEIAEELGVSRSTIYSILCEVKEKLLPHVYDSAA